ncbi:AI-2E family transporter [Oxalobacteraceae bacterium R-40]|uniref:AI-2E family transporter n=1 Tax=Keguizhuia sedimenti TaxID=3064264 RepID=A0ABU1BLZ0_9BURK|nr:AI-2E family transporter [Oxalobacteraceae bacterium R-40]
MSLFLTPEQKQTALWLGIGILLVALLGLLGPVLAPFIAAAILAYALNPMVDWLASKRIGRLAVPRVLAVVAVLLLIFAVLLLLIIIVVPILQKQVPLLQQRIPGFLIKLDEWLQPWLRQLGFQMNFDVNSIREMAAQKLEESGQQIWQTLISSIRVGGAALLGWLATLFLIPIVLFYLLVDWHALLEKFRNAIPRRWVNKAVTMANEVDSLLAQYLRGQLLVMLILAVFYSSALAIAGFDVALPVGIITGLFVFIPYVGFGFGLILALIAAVLQFDGMQGLIAVAIIYSIGQALESFILTPYLVGERIGLHPVAVIFALMAFGQLFGFAGVLLALPASAILSVAMQHLRASYIDSTFYKQS